MLRSVCAVVNDNRDVLSKGSVDSRVDVTSNGQRPNERQRDIFPLPLLAVPLPLLDYWPGGQSTLIPELTNNV